MDFTKISKAIPIEPYINCDGWYAQCNRCWAEINPTDEVCPKCGQMQDWFWLSNENNNSKE